jgi:integrase
MGFIAKTTSGGYRVRWRTPEGAARSKTFPRGDREKANNFLTSVEHSKLQGAYIDVRAGRVTFGAFAAAWQSSQIHRESTALVVDSHLRNHMLPAFGKRPIASIRPSEVQAWIRGLGEQLSPSTVRVVVQHARSIFRAAVRDRLIASSPCDGAKVPQSGQRRVEPLDTAAVLALIDALPDRYRGLAVLGAGAGLRPGEALGVTLNEIDFLRRSLTVRQQLVTLPGSSPRLGEPKTADSERTIPLPNVVTQALAWHLERFKPGELGLVFTQEDGAPIARNRFGDVWRATVKRAGLPATVRFHDLRHFYASALIRHGESVKTVQARLGHKSAVVTLDTYGHLWPDSEDRTRRALDEVLGGPASPTRHAAERAE